MGVGKGKFSPCFPPLSKTVFGFRLNCEPPDRMVAVELVAATWPSGQCGVHRPVWLGPNHMWKISDCSITHPAQASRRSWPTRNQQEAGDLESSSSYGQSATVMPRASDVEEGQTTESLQKAECVLPNARQDHVENFTMTVIKESVIP